MSTLYDPAKIRALAATGDKFYQGAWWVLRQQEAAQLTGHRAAFMSDKISMDEAREKVRGEQDKISRTEPTEEAWAEYARLMQARLER